MGLAEKTCNGIMENTILTRYEYHKNILRNEVKAYKSIKIPTQNYSINNMELANWIFEILSPKELEELVFIIKTAKKRSNNIKSLFATIAVGLVNRK